jgi:hypothetical protein
LIGVDAFLEQLSPHWRPHPGQREFLQSGSKFKVLACGRRWGKTDACAVEVLAALDQPSPTRHLILAPTADQASLLFGRVEELASGLGWPIKVRRTPHPRLELGPHRLQARSAHVPRSLRGLEATHIVIDEAAFLPEEVVTEIALPMLAATQGRITLISTPRGRNHFWRFFRMGERGEHGIWSRQAPSCENPMIPESFLAIQRELISGRAYRVEYEAAFEDQEGRVFRQEAIEQALVADLIEPAEGHACIGIDWARYGDATALAVVKGSRDAAALIELHQWQGLAWAEQIRRAEDVIRAWPGAKVLCDATGVGDPVLEALRASLPDRRLDGFTFTAASKSELVDGLAWQIERRALAMAPHPELIRELEHFEASLRPSGSLALEGRGFHDDLVMALALAVRQLPRTYSGGLLLGAPRQFSRSRRRRRTP